MAGYKNPKTISQSIDYSAGTRLMAESNKNLNNQQKRTKMVMKKKYI